MRAPKRAFERSLQRLQLDYLDLYLIHQPFGDVYGAWRAMEELYREGRTRAIGVSNFHPDRLMDLIVHNDVVPAVNQIETHPFNQQIETQQFLQENQVQIESWGPFAEARNNIFQNELLRSIASKHQRTVAQVILRWLTNVGSWRSPNQSIRNASQENFDVFDFELSPEDMQAIVALDTKSSSFFDHRDPAVVKRLGEARSPHVRCTPGSLDPLRLTNTDGRGIRCKTYTRSLTLMHLYRRIKSGWRHNCRRTHRWADAERTVPP